MRIKITLLCFTLLATSYSIGQYVLQTPDGKKVQLNANGTWVYVESAPLDRINSIPKTSSSLYSSRLKIFEVWYNPSDWLVDTSKKSNTYTWDANFFSSDYAIQGYCLESRLSMPLENLEGMVRQQWQSNGEIKSFSSKKDTVNGIPVVTYEVEYVQSNIVYTYKGLLYSDAKGSFQIFLGTQKEIFDEDKGKIEQLLKGFTKK